MFDMRAYIVSLIAVFLALAIGILLGSVVVDKGLLVEQQKALVQKIQTQINDLRSQNSNMRTRLRQSQEYADRVFIDLASNQLIDKQVLLFVIPHSSVNLKKELVDALSLTNAKVSVMSINSISLNLEDQRVTEQLSTYFGEEVLTGADYENRIAKELANGILGTKDPAFISLLNNLNIIAVENSLERTPDVIIIMGEEKKSGNNFLNNFLLPFMSELTNLNANIVVAEPTDSETSYVKEYKNIGVRSTIDNVDTVYGKTAMIYVLKGASGHFGTKRTAEKFLPTP